MKKTTLFRRFLTAFSWLFLLVFTLIAVFTVSSNLDLISNYKSLIVQSGSMEPVIMTGDVIIIANRNQYRKNEVIAFLDENHRKVTHRVMEVAYSGDKVIITTKGDANRVQDRATVTNDRIIGKVILVIPKLGYLVAFARSLPGLILLVGLPGLLVVVDEFSKLLTRQKK